MKIRKIWIDYILPILIMSFFIAMFKILPDEVKLYISDFHAGVYSILISYLFIDLIKYN